MLVHKGLKMKKIYTYIRALNIIIVGIFFFHHISKRMARGAALHRVPLKKSGYLRPFMRKERELAILTKMVTPILLPDRTGTRGLILRLNMPFTSPKRLTRVTTPTILSLPSMM